MPARPKRECVLSLQERYSDALAELRALDSSVPEMLQYYGAL